MRGRVAHTVSSSPTPIARPNRGRPRTATLGEVDVDGEVDAGLPAAQHGCLPRSRTWSVDRRSFAPDGDCLLFGLTNRRSLYAGRANLGPSAPTGSAGVNENMPRTGFSFVAPRCRVNRAARRSIAWCSYAASDSIVHARKVSSTGRSAASFRRVSVSCPLPVRSGSPYGSRTRPSGRRRG
jgi:hypothetical protein